MVSLWMLNKNRYIYAWSPSFAWGDCIIEIFFSIMNWTLVFSDDLLLVNVAWSVISINGMWLYLGINSVMLPDHVYTWIELGLELVSCHRLWPILNIFLWPADSHIRTNTWLDLPLPMMQKSEAYFLIRIDITCGLFFKTMWWILHSTSMHFWGFTPLCPPRCNPSRRAIGCVCVHPLFGVLFLCSDA
jgi:hypothetical protein